MPHVPVLQVVLLRYQEFLGVMYRQQVPKAVKIDGACLCCINFAMLPGFLGENSGRRPLAARLQADVVAMKLMLDAVVSDLCVVCRVGSIA